MFDILVTFDCDKCENYFRFIASTALTTEQYKTMTIEEAENYIFDNLNTIFADHKKCDICYNKYCLDCVNIEQCEDCDKYICDPCYDHNAHKCEQKKSSDNK